MSRLVEFFKRQGAAFYVISVATVFSVIAFALGLTVNSSYWGTENVLADATASYVIFSLLSLLCEVAMMALSQIVKNKNILYLLCTGIAAFAMAALASMAYNAVVEIAYIYGEGNLEMGNVAAVNGSVIMFVSAAMFVIVMGLAAVACLLPLKKDCQEQ